MKRSTFIIAACCLVLTASAQKQEKKALVAYFSATGTTKAVAEQLKEVAGADLYEIKPAQPYTDADLDWRNKQSRSSVEMKDKSSRPAITGKLKKRWSSESHPSSLEDGRVATEEDEVNMKDYDVVYVGFPIWWNTCPTIINTFMELYDFKGKTVIPFATSGGSSIKQACEDLKTAYPKVNWKEGKLLNRTTKKELEDWVKEEVASSQR